MKNWLRNHARVAFIGLVVLSAVLSLTLFMVADISLGAALAIYFLCCFVAFVW